MTLPAVMMISGSGTTLRNLLGEIAKGTLPVEICHVISSNSEATGLEYARQAGIATSIIRRRQFADAEKHSKAVFDLVRRLDARLVIMGGYLEHLLIPEDFENRVVNIHPSLIPAFCGKGYYGLRVHRAVLEYGVKVTGCTVHFVDNQYDHGPIIAQRVVAVRDDDTPESLAARVFAVECQLYPEVLRWIAAGRVRVVGRRVLVSGESHSPE
ncbi:MAG: phosphoribosylglycinamide formyltransferase [Pirellulaceae bacterium]|nr:MAG: phosphoribosylglycinamide formyltransferase [Pirellulaceae bacterium]